MVTTRSGRQRQSPIPSVVTSAITSTTAFPVSTTRRRRTSRPTAQLNNSLSVKKAKVETDPVTTRIKNCETQIVGVVESKEPVLSPCSNTTTTPLLTLPEDIVVGELRSRPSKRNRSPYVGDVWIEEEQREAIVHLPNLDMGGKCIPGAKICMKPARDKKGNLIGKEATNPNYGTPKCEFIAQLLYVDESDLGYDSVWVGAHPSLGEKVTEQLLRHNLLGANFPTVKSFQREVRNVGGTDMRADFLIHHTDPLLPPRILEVKTVVDTDYAVSSVPINRTKCVFTNDHIPYVRTAIFPWGSGNQKGPNGEAVVSARAIKHVRELTRIVKDDNPKYTATILFVVIRQDAKAFKPNDEACPSFVKYLKQARDAGVQILAKQVVWGHGENIGKCYEGDLLEIVWP